MGIKTYGPDEKKSKAQLKKLSKASRLGDKYVPVTFSSPKSQSRYRETLLLAQEGECAICGKHESEFKRQLALDHNHETGEPRGLLCTNCNLLIGCSGEDVDVLSGAMMYLRKWNL